MKYLGIDYGDKRIGLALGDNETRMAIPFKVAANPQEVIRIIEEEQIDAVVVGMPYKLDKTAGQDTGVMEKKVEKFIKILGKDTKVRIVAVDERLTSKAADSLSGTSKTKASRDAIAAMLILQTYLDSCAV